MTPLKLASVVNNYDVMRQLINHGGRLSAADAAAPLSIEKGGHDDQLSRIAYMVLSLKIIMLSFTTYCHARLSVSIKSAD